MDMWQPFKEWYNDLDPADQAGSILTGAALAETAFFYEVGDPLRGTAALFASAVGAATLILANRRQQSNPEQPHE